MRAKLVVTGSKFEGVEYVLNKYSNQYLRQEKRLILSSSHLSINYAPYVLLGLKNTAEELGLNVVEAYFSLERFYYENDFRLVMPTNIRRLFGNNLKVPPKFESLILVSKIVSEINCGKLPSFKTATEAYDHYGIRPIGPILSPDSGDEIDCMYMSHPFATLIVEQLIISKPNWLLYPSDLITRLFDNSKLRSQKPSFETKIVENPTYKCGRLVFKIHGQWSTSVLSEFKLWADRMLHGVLTNCQRQVVIDIIPCDIRVATCNIHDMTIRFPKRRTVGLLETRPSIIRTIALAKHLLTQTQG